MPSTRRENVMTGASRQTERDRKTKQDESVDGRPVGARRAESGGGSSTLCVLQNGKAKARPKGVNHKGTGERKSQCDIVVKRAPAAILVWECDRPPRRSVGKGAVRVHAVTIQHRRVTRSIDHERRMTRRRWVFLKIPALIPPELFKMREIKGEAEEIGWERREGIGEGPSTRRQAL